MAYGKNTLSARPVLIRDKFYLMTNFLSSTQGAVFAFDLRTGKPLGKPGSAGSHDAGCSVPIGSAVGLYHRDYGHSVFDLRQWQKFRLTGATRPSCWPSTLPVGGLVLAPEAGAACSCGLSYQMSFALAPKVSRFVSSQD